VLDKNVVRPFVHLIHTERWKKKGITAMNPLMASPAVSMIFLSCVKKADVAGPGTGYTIQGNIQYWRDETAIVGVTVGISGMHAEAACVTDSLGNYRFTGILNGEYTISPIKEAGLDYYFAPDYKTVIVSGRDVEVGRIFALKYPKIILNNNGPRTVLQVKKYKADSPFARVENIVDEPIAGQILPSSDSEVIRIMPDTWGLFVLYKTHSSNRYAYIEPITIQPEDSLVYSLNSIIRISNNSTKTVTQVKVNECNVVSWGENLLEQEVPPNSVSQDIYVWNGCRDILLIYPENSDSMEVQFSDITVVAGDTIVIPFEI